ncbi:MAG: hypothetical protein SCI25_04785 [Desulfuromonadales bacterium]|nr:hypothetical protein [Desulfuromonadales bacterium]MDW7757749.1 hypothetical protein [Desulfuromonadales bacterium]
MGSLDTNEKVTASPDTGVGHFTKGETFFNTSKAFYPKVMPFQASKHLIFSLVSALTHKAIKLRQSQALRASWGMIEDCTGIVTTPSATPGKKCGGVLPHRESTHVRHDTG